MNKEKLELEEFEMKLNNPGPGEQGGGGEEEENDSGPGSQGGGGND